jgi:hypothetical protein
MNTTIIIGYCAGSAMLALMLIALLYAIVVPQPDRWSKNYFITFFSLLTVCVCSCFVSTFFYGKPGSAQVEKISCYIESLLISVLMPIPTFLLLHSCIKIKHPNYIPYPVKQQEKRVNHFSRGIDQAIL